MKKRDDTVFLRHILGAINAIDQYTEGMTFEDFVHHSMAHDDVIRQIEIIGEAARNISEKYRESRPLLPWLKMIGIRNKIIHEYFNLNLSVGWDTIKDDLPHLRSSIEELLH